jgi:hypothetical protein
MPSAQHQAVPSEARHTGKPMEILYKSTTFISFLCLPYLVGDDLNLEPLRDVRILPAGKPGMRVGLVDCGLPLCRTNLTHAQFSWEIDPRVKSYESIAKSPVKLLKVIQSIFWSSTTVVMTGPHPLSTASAAGERV